MLPLIRTMMHCSSFPLCNVFADSKTIQHITHTRKNTWSMYEHSAIRLNERMRERLGFLGKCLPWSTMFHCRWLYFVEFFVIFDMCSKNRIWYMTFHLFVCFWIQILKMLRSRLLEVDRFQNPLFEVSLFEITKSYFEFYDVRFRTDSLTFSNLLFELLSFRVHRFCLNVRCSISRFLITYCRLPICRQNTLGVILGHFWSRTQNNNGH